MLKTKNLEQEELRYLRFIAEIVAPVLAVINLEHETGYHAPLQITSRKIQDEFGFAASECFKLMFKLIKRGGFSTKAQVGFPSRWVPNHQSLRIWVEWHTAQQPERTCRMLKHALLEANCDKYEWDKLTSSWIPQAMRAATLEEQRMKWRLAKLANQKTEDEKEEENAIHH